jgi:hypothetical protein
MKTFAIAIGSTRREWPRTIHLSTSDYRKNGFTPEMSDEQLDFGVMGD